jgi:hypothetical protein
MQKSIYVTGKRVCYDLTRDYQFFFGGEVHAINNNMSQHNS